jgi:hypothetical protein
LTKQAEQSADLGSLVTSLKDALRDLPASDELIVRDFEGNEYKLRGVLPARRQVQVFRALGTLLESGQQMFAVAAAESGANWVKLLVGMVTDDAVVEQLGRTFRAAFPDVVKDRDPLDVFPLEEILASLVPLLARFIKRSGMAFASAGE